VLHGPLKFPPPWQGGGWEGVGVNLPSPVRGRRCPEGTDEGRFSVETNPCNSLSRWRERDRERVGAFHLTPAGERPGAGGVFFSFNLCPLYACHSVPLFSPRSCPMNGQDMGLRIWRTPRYPRSNQRPPRKPAPFFGAYRNQTPPQKEGPQPFRAGGGKRGPCITLA
jgi:hypothetical protein